MFSKKIQVELKKQLNRELESSQLYLSMASWVEYKYGGLDGIYNFLYDHSDEERRHMLKLIKYINKRGGYVDNFNKSEYYIFEKISYNSLMNLFHKLFEHEKKISLEINFLVELSLHEKDFFTYNFLQWYVEEQIEEEVLIKKILDKIELIGEDKGGLYLFNHDIKNFYQKNVDKN
ncbi:ferritin [Blattabacterium punctulatus]|uniref:Ferritin n=1 Tax=Blattabacterium punctulatus TaxID=164514 RepID=A0ABN5M575_9FLAO|nr:ferritin [Blattabacterium punctulatus]AWU39765.1 ferritin [Blattabacterium punctulatus]AWU40308.1 ferritin [Blattabacterium punctulatus]AWU42564.1 ferritin [Blattabacterium punctulatus]AWU43108.1 ferritin [Blattabacterium punctulatus]AWU44761.1 ferritin [Blattabacterium punctulatus]